ncbi:MAG: hypothetical protein WHX93_05670 [bacterium]
MAGLKPVLYFPYIDLEAKPLWGLLLWFEKILVLQPVFSCLSPYTEEAQKMGWVHVRRPLGLSLDHKSVRALLGEWERLGNLYQESGYLRYLHYAGLESQEEPGWDLVKKIRDYGTPLKDHSPQEETLRGQLLLQLAQDLDRQRSEIREELAGLKQTQARMFVHLGVEEADVPHWMGEPLATLEQDDILIPQRVRAFAEMMCALDQEQDFPLLTPNRLVLEHLLERAAQEGEEMPLALMHLRLPMFSPLDSREAARVRQALADLLPWKTFCDKMEGFLQELRSMEARELQASLPRARALASYFHEQVRDNLLETVGGMEPRWEEGWTDAMLQLVVMPAWDVRSLWGSYSRGETNLLIMHLETSPEKAMGGSLK